MHTRMIGECQFQLTVEVDGATRRPVSADRIANTLEAWVSPTPERGGSLSITLSSEPGMDTFERISASGRELAVANLRNIAELLRVVNAVLYTGVFEPQAVVLKCTFDPDGDGSKHPCTLALVTTQAANIFDQSSSGSPSAVFPVGSWRRAVAKANKDNDDRPELGTAIREMHARLRPRLDRSVLGDYVEYFVLESVLMKFSDFFAGQRIGDMSRTGVELAFKLLDAANRMREPGGLDLVETIGAAFIANASEHGGEAERKAAKDIARAIRSLGDREIAVTGVGLMGAPRHTGR